VERAMRAPTRHAATTASTCAAVFTRTAVSPSRIAVIPSQGDGTVRPDLEPGDVRALTAGAGGELLRERDWSRRPRGEVGGVRLAAQEVPAGLPEPAAAHRLLAQPRGQHAVDQPIDEL